MDGRGREHGTLSVLRRRGDGSPFAAVVPLAVRRSARQATRHARAMLEGRVNAPRRAGTMLTATVLGATLAYGSALSEDTAGWIDVSAAAMGLGISDLRIEGARETDPAAIAEALGVGRTLSLAAIGSAEGRAAVAALPWVTDARVVKSYPGTLVVDVVEREAVALWRVGGRTLLLDAAGAPIVDADGRSLPLLVGEGADGAVADGLEIFAAVPEVTPSIKALVRVASRRWDLVTHRNVVVQLPAEGTEDALRRLATLQFSQGVLDKEVAVIDLRLTDRVAFRLSPDAAALRTERVEDAVKARKDSRKSREVQL